MTGTTFESNRRIAITHHLRLCPYGDLLLRDRVGDGNDDGTQGVPNDIQQGLALLTMEDFDQGATGPLPNVDRVLLH